VLIKRIQLISLGGLALAIVISLGIAQPAVAMAEDTALCSAAEMPCLEENLYPEGTEITASLVPATVATFESAFLTIKCKESQVRAKTVGALSTPLELSLLELSFPQCQWNTNSCTVSLSKHGNVFLDSGVVTIPFIQLKATCLTQCLLGDELELGASAALGGSLNILATEEPLQNKTFCYGEAWLFSAEYETTAAKPLYLSS
jgi:hypothetical protein